MRIAEAETILTSIREQRPVLGAGLTAMLPDERNLSPAARLTAALGL
jgi:hypothetical protein